MQGKNASSAHVQHMYMDGQECELTGKPRQVDVRFFCAPDGGQIMGIEELVSCQYIVVVGVPVLCLPALGITSPISSGRVR
jgi:protein OS-9